MSCGAISARGGLRPRPHRCRQPLGREDAPKLPLNKARADTLIERLLHLLASQVKSPAHPLQTGRCPTLAVKGLRQLDLGPWIKERDRVALRNVAKSSQAQGIDIEQSVWITTVVDVGEKLVLQVSADSHLRSAPGSSLLDLVLRALQYRISGRKIVRRNEIESKSGRYPCRDDGDFAHRGSLPFSSPAVLASGGNQHSGSRGTRVSTPSARERRGAGRSTRRELCHDRVAPPRGFHSSSEWLQTVAFSTSCGDARSLGFRA